MILFEKPVTPLIFISFLLLLVPQFQNKPILIFHPLSPMKGFFSDLEVPLKTDTNSLCHLGRDIRLFNHPSPPTHQSTQRTNTPWFFDARQFTLLASRIIYSCNVKSSGSGTPGHFMLQFDVNKKPKNRSESDPLSPQPNNVVKQKKSLDSIKWRQGSRIWGSWVDIFCVRIENG